MSDESFYDEEEYRDHIATVNEDGSRKWIYPKKPKGRFYNYRTWMSGFLLLVLVGLPFIKVNGDPLFLFNVLERKFILFGIVFTPQDLHLFALAMITLMLFIVLFTVVFGRLFCGWVCPQTIFMEMVFRKIEYWIEGDANQQRRLNKEPWSPKKFRKKLLKHVIFYLIAVFIANVFLCYIIGVEQVGAIIREPISEHFGGFIAMLVFSGLFYGVFAFFREQVCVAVCPYGRLQGVLLVKNTIVVIYDWVRGEPRGKIRKNRKKATMVELPVAEQPAPLGDCIDCKLCIHVCPTGIDIRNGTQLECVNCTACMDACDEVMEKVGREKGLIRYDSHANLDEGNDKIFTKRVWAYAAVLVGLIGFQAYLFGTRTDVETILLRTPGMMYQEVDDTHVSNLYNFQLINKTKTPISDIEFRLQEGEGRIRIVGQVPDIGKQQVGKGSLFVELDKSELQGRKTKVKIDVFSNGEKIDEVQTNFLGPIQ